MFVKKEAERENKKTARRTRSEVNEEVRSKLTALAKEDA